jgi:hypothetical protein
MGDVIELPRRPPSGRGTTAAAMLSGAASMRWLASWDIDDWGRDDTLARAAARVAHVRWDAVVGGTELLPERGPAVIVVNSRRFHLTPWWVALTLSDAVGRPVRFVGRPDTAPFGALARRLGGLLARPDEIAGALRHDQLLVLGLSSGLDPRKLGSIDPQLLGPAVELKVPVFPAGVALSETSRSARIEVAGAVAAPQRRRGPLGERELTRRVQIRIGELVEAFGGSRTGTPLDWLPWPAIGER